MSLQRDLVCLMLIDSVDSLIDLLTTSSLDVIRLMTLFRAKENLLCRCLRAQKMAVIPLYLVLPPVFSTRSDTL